MSITQFAGPFPTDWASPSSCTSFVSENVIVLDNASSCLPKDFNTDTDVYYSPGTACPSGYTAHDYCSAAGRDRATTVTCCPVRGDMTMWCVDDPKALREPWVDYQCTWSAGTDMTEIVVTSSSRQEVYAATITMSGGDGVNAYGIRMVFEPSDLSMSTSSSSSPTEPRRISRQSSTSDGTQSSTTSGSTSGANADTDTNTDTDTDTKDKESGGLSTAAVASIAAVVPLVVIAILAGAFFMYRRRHKQGSQAVPPSNAGGAAGVYYDDSNKPMPLYTGVPPAGELYGVPEVKHELSEKSMVVELPAEVPYASPTVIQSPASGWPDHHGTTYVPQR